MPRSDRLMRLLHILRDGGIYRAEDLADRLHVSVRTIYRDMDTLVASGVPVSGARGTGYQVRDSVALPPMHLTLEEVEALQLGLSAVAQSGDPTLAKAASGLVQKFETIMPDDSHDTLGAPAFAAATRSLQYLTVIRQAIRSRQKLHLIWDGQQSTLRPLQLQFWARLWTCIGWDEVQDRFIEIGLDQITSLRVLPGLFVEEDGKTLRDFKAIQGAAKANQPSGSEA